MTDSWIHRLKLTALTTFFCCLPLPAFAGGSVDIIRYLTEGDTVTLRVSVVNEERIPVQGLTPPNFTIQTTDNQGNSVTLNPNDLKLLSSQQSQPDPAYLIILLDLSGSMENNDLSGNQKLQSAVDGIKDFITQIKTEKIPLNLSIVPFGYGCSLFATDDNNNERVKIDLSANQNIIADNFKDINNSDLLAQLDRIASTSQKLCSATNIYQPLTEAVEYLGNQFPIALFSDKKQTEIPRLAVILFTDGYDVFNQRRNEKRRFRDLTKILNNHPQITVHTMGYGEKLDELRDRINFDNPRNCRLADSELTVDNVSQYCRLPTGGDINQYIVDEQRLTEIANTTGGIHQFPGNPQEVVDTLRTFLTTLREYEIQYQQPNAERATQYSTMVTVNAPERQLNATSQGESIRFDNFIFKAPSWQARLILFIVILLVVEGGRRYFIQWSQRLQREAETGVWEN